MQSNPQLKSVDQLPDIEIALEHSIAVLLENGPSFSVLFARRFGSDGALGGVKLADCQQFRIEADNTRLVRKFRRVEISDEREEE